MPWLIMFVNLKMSRLARPLLWALISIHYTLVILASVLPQCNYADSHQIGSGGTLLIICVIYVLCVSCLVSVHCCLVVTCWERADLLALVCDVLTVFLSLFHVVSWVRCGTLLYRFLIFAALLISIIHPKIIS